MRAKTPKHVRSFGAVLFSVSVFTGGCSIPAETSPGAASSHLEVVSAVGPDGPHHPSANASISRSDRVKAQIAAAGFQDVAIAESAGWKSSLETLGCFQDPVRGGMGVHYINDALLDAKVDVAKPEALVYELNAKGAVTGLVAHEYIVPINVWTKKTPPHLFGVAFHRHPSLPLYVLHAWLWKDNARGDFDDWNPAVRQCPPGVPIFGHHQIDPDHGAV